MAININKEDLELIRKFEDIRKRGYYCDGGQVTELHNRILGTRLSSTNCASCISARINALVAVANRFESMIEVDKKPQEAIKQEDLDNTKAEENKAVTGKNKKVKK